MINSCLSPMKAWYLKYDYYTLNQSKNLIANIEEAYKALNLSIKYLEVSEILNYIPDFSWSESNFSNNIFDKHLQKFLIKILKSFLDFLKNELICLEETHPDFKTFEKAFNIIYLELFYSQTFWKAAQNKPFPDYFRFRIFSSLFRFEILLFEIHETSIKENEVFAQILSFLSEILKKLLLELKELENNYQYLFKYLVRFFELLKFFPLSKTTVDLEKFISSSFPSEKVFKLKQSILDYSHNKNSMKETAHLYQMLIENSFSESKIRKNTNDEIDFLKNLSKNHSNSFEEVPLDELDALHRLSTRASKTIHSVSVYQNDMKSQNNKSPNHLMKSLTFKSDQEEKEEYDFINQITNSYFTTQIMNSERFMGSSLNKNMLPPENQYEMSIISSKNLLKSPNLPFNSFLGRNLPETAIDEALGSKIISGVKSHRSKKNEENLQQMNEPKEYKSNNFLRISTTSLKPQLVKKNSEIGEKLNQNLFNILLSKDSNQIRDNILIAKNKQRRGGNMSVMEPANIDIDNFFEKRRKDRIIHSNRESAIKDISDDFMTKSKREEKPSPEKMSVILDDKDKVSKAKLSKGIEVVNVKEKDFIKINKMTEITEKLMATLCHEHASQEPYDEEIIEVSEDQEDENQGFYDESKNVFNVFKGTFDEKKEEYWVIPGIQIKNFKQKNIMEFFKPIYRLSERRNGMYDRIIINLLSDKSHLVEQVDDKFCYFRKEIRDNK